MGVRSKHKEYDGMADRWQRCRDVADGGDAVKKAGTKYLPSLTDQTLTAYDAYRQRATWFNATWRTIEGFKGMLFRKPMVIDVPEGLKPLLEDVSLRGEPLDVFAQQLALECLKVGRVGILCDYPLAPESNGIPLTVARAEAMGLRPMLLRYAAEDILNWQTSRVGNVVKLTKVVLREEHSMPKPDDEFDQVAEYRYRVLDLVLVQDKGGQNGYTYRQRLYRVNPDNDRDEQIGTDYFPLMNGKPLGEIPFVFLGTDNLAECVDIPPLIDLVDVNLAHYRVSADYEHGCHFTGLPTPVISGYTPSNPGEKLYIGSQSAWVFTDPSASASFLEFTGQGLSALKENLKDKQEQMAMLGARLLTADRTPNETAMAAAIHTGGETSVLAAMAGVLGMGLTRALGWFAAWAGNATKKVSVALNKDFFPVTMDAQKLAGLVSAWQTGAISQQTLFDNLKRGEVIADDVSFEDEQARIGENPVPTPPNAGMTTTKTVSSDGGNGSQQQ